MPKLTPLPPSLAPRGLRRPVAAAYFGVSATTFDKMRAAGQVPVPRIIMQSIEVWDRQELDEAFTLLPTTAANDNNPWDSDAPTQA